jgi:hypothetical protein
MSDVKTKTRNYPGSAKTAPLATCIGYKKI